MQLLGSESYVQGKLEILNSQQIGELKEVLIKKKHPRFRKEFATSRHQPFGKTSDYAENIRKVDNLKLAKMIKIVGLLMQTKAYLFWRNKEALCNYRVEGYSDNA